MSIAALSVPRKKVGNISIFRDGSLDVYIKGTGKGTISTPFSDSSEILVHSRIVVTDACINR